MSLDQFLDDDLLDLHLFASGGLRGQVFQTQPSLLVFVLSPGILPLNKDDLVFAPVKVIADNELVSVSRQSGPGFRDQQLIICFELLLSARVTNRLLRPGSP